MNQAQRGQKMRIRCGTAGDILSLKALWKRCFGDEDEYINTFFEMLYEDGNVLLAEEKGVLMGASFFLPGKLYQHTGWQEIRYVYALATYPVFRGRGIAGGLLSFAYEYYHTPLIAEPAEEGLVSGFYEPLGFCKAFYLSQIQTELPGKSLSLERDLQAASSERGGLYAAETSGKGNLYAAEMHRERSLYRHWMIEKADAESYGAVRDARFCSSGFVSWPLRHIAFAIQEHRVCGGDALLLTQADRKELLLYYKEEERIVVTETTLAEEEVQEFFAARFPKMGETLVVRYACNAGCGKLTGMLYGLSLSGGYLNLSLD